MKVSADANASRTGSGPVGATASANADLEIKQTMLAVERSGKDDWTDPYVGVRVLHTLNERWKLAGCADYGGFGVGSDSTWQVLVGAEYSFSKTAAMKFGYRELSIDYDKHNFIYDMKNKGAYVGVGIRF